MLISWFLTSSLLTLYFDIHVESDVRNIKVISYIGCIYPSTPDVLISHTIARVNDTNTKATKRKAHHCMSGLKRLVVFMSLMFILKSCFLKLVETSLRHNSQDCYCCWYSYTLLLVYQRNTYNSYSSTNRITLNFTLKSRTYVCLIKKPRPNVYVRQR